MVAENQFFAYAVVFRRISGGRNISYKHLFSDTRTPKTPRIQHQPLASINCSSSLLFLSLSSVQTSSICSTTGETGSALSSWVFIHCSKWMALHFPLKLVFPICLHLCSINVSSCFFTSWISMQQSLPFLPQSMARVWG